MASSASPFAACAKGCFRICASSSVPIFQAEIGSQRNWHTVRLTDTEDLYYLLRVWLDNQDRFIRSFNPRKKDYAAGLDWPQKINGFHSEKWARQRHYADDEVSGILDAVAATLNAIGASSQAASAEQLADELEAYLYQRARINRLEASYAGRVILSPRRNRCRAGDC